MNDVVLTLLRTTTSRMPLIFTTALVQNAWECKPVFVASSGDDFDTMRSTFVNAVMLALLRTASRVPLIFTITGKSSGNVTGFP